jgi:hypothetical protein
MPQGSAANSLAAAAPAVRFERLLSLYAIVPACVLAILVDQTLLHGSLRAHLPRSPEAWVYFTVLFNFPHIVASHLIFADPEYLRRYWRHLVGAILVFVPLTFAIVALSFEALIIFAQVVTFFHLVTQQVGLTGAQLRTKDWSFPAWKAMGLVSGIAALLTITDASPFLVRTRGPMALVSLAALVPSTLLALRLTKLSMTQGGKRYLWANQSMFTLMSVFVLAGYPIFSALMLRWVHDLTALYVYGVHDTNRNRETRNNLVYRALSWSRLPVYVLGPVCAIFLAAIAERVLPPRWGIQVVYWLSGLHYYMEGVVWKSGTLHRASAAFR